MSSTSLASAAAPAIRFLPGVSSYPAFLTRWTGMWKCKPNTLFLPNLLPVVVFPHSNSDLMGTIRWITWSFLGEESEGLGVCLHRQNAYTDRTELGSCPSTAQPRRDVRRAFSKWKEI